MCCLCHSRRALCISLPVIKYFPLPFLNMATRHSFLIFTADDFHTVFVLVFCGSDLVSPKQFRIRDRSLDLSRELESRTSRYFETGGNERPPFFLFSFFSFFKQLFRNVNEPFFSFFLSFFQAVVQHAINSYLLFYCCFFSSDQQRMNDFLSKRATCQLV